MVYRRIRFLLPIILCIPFYAVCQDFELWGKAELNFQSGTAYDNPIYDVKEFYCLLISPSGNKFEVDGFWDGEKDWKVRFKPDELGVWNYEAKCSDTLNLGLNGVKGTFNVVKSTSTLDIYTKGKIIHPSGSYHLAHSDGTPFLWIACTAWNGALRSTELEWETYLEHRKKTGYNTIQFVTTQWRGGPVNADGQTAYTKDGPININTKFFNHMDKKVDRINAHGLIAAPVMLWGLPFGEGRHLSPGYDLPYEDARLLAKYIKARYGGNHVVWIFGGDAKYTGEMESRWKFMGRSVFKRKQDLVSLHPLGRAWIGKLYDSEDWLDIIGYQSSHSNEEKTVNWINRGPVVMEWQEISPRPLINMEPNYEEIHFKITDEDVRNASYWSLFSAPISGITYGANGLWPWLRKGELIINHEKTAGISDWETSMKFPGSIQIGYLAEFMRRYEWWKLRPASKLLINQPSDKKFDEHIAVVKSRNGRLILVYLPKKQAVRIRVGDKVYNGQWFNPVLNEFSTAKVRSDGGTLTATPPSDSDWVLELKLK